MDRVESAIRGAYGSLKAMGRALQAAGDVDKAARVRTIVGDLFEGPDAEFPMGVLHGRATAPETDSGGPTQPGSTGYEEPTL